MRTYIILLIAILAANCLTSTMILADEATDKKLEALDRLLIGDQIHLRLENADQISGPYINHSSETLLINYSHEVDVASISEITLSGNKGKRMAKGCALFGGLIGGVAGYGLWQIYQDDDQETRDRELLVPISAIGGAALSGIIGYIFGSSIKYEQQLYPSPSTSD